MNERKERIRRRWRYCNVFRISHRYVGMTKLLLDNCLSPLLIFAFSPFVCARKTFCFFFSILSSVSSSEPFSPPHFVLSAPCSSPCFVFLDIFPLFDNPLVRYANHNFSHNLIVKYICVTHSKCSKCLNGIWLWILMFQWGFLKICHCSKNHKIRKVGNSWNWIFL